MDANKKEDFLTYFGESYRKLLNAKDKGNDGYIRARDLAKRDKMHEIYDSRYEQLYHYVDSHFDSKERYCRHIVNFYLNNYRKSIERFELDEEYNLLDEELFPEFENQSPDVIEALYTLKEKLESLEKNLDMIVEERVLVVLKKLTEK